MKGMKNFLSAKHAKRREKGLSGFCNSRLAVPSKPHRIWDGMDFFDVFWRVWRTNFLPNAFISKKWGRAGAHPSGGIAWARLVWTVAIGICIGAVFLGEAQAEEWPATVTLKEVVTFPAVMDGKVIGKINVPAGSKVKLVVVEQGRLVVEYQGGRQQVAATATDFAEQVAERKAAVSGGSASADANPSAAGSPQAGTSGGVDKKGVADVQTSGSGAAGVSQQAGAQRDDGNLQETKGPIVNSPGAKGLADRISALQRAGENRPELEKALAASRDTAAKEMELLISRASQYDLVNLTAEHLLDNVGYYQKAKKEMPWARSIPEAMWLEYVLPYRVADEDLDDWRPEFYAELSPLVKDCHDTKAAARAIHQWLYQGDDGKGRIAFKVSESRDQTPRQLLNQTKIGRCFEMNLLLVALLRSIGIPARHAGVPWWTTMDYYHYWVEYWDTETHQWLPLEPGANPDALMEKGQSFAAVYAFPGFYEERDPVGKERWDLMTNVTASYRKVGTLDVRCGVAVSGPVTFSVYSWSCAAWRLAATMQGNGKASFELAANEKQYPYLVSASVNGRIGWQLVRVTADKTESVELTPGSQPETVVEYKK